MSPGGVNRTYDSPRRRQQAEATRLAILAAARRLMEADGFAATTIAAVAAEAGVSLKTVYVVVETKAGLLRAVWNLTLRGDEDGGPVSERPWYREVLDEPDPARQLALNARNSRAVKERAGGLLRVIRDASRADPDVGALWRRIQDDFHANQAVVVASLDAKGALAPGLDAERATDILWTLNHPDVWHLLVGERGWEPAAYERWFGETSVAQLLAAG